MVKGAYCELFLGGLGASTGSVAGGGAAASPAAEDPVYRM